MVDSGQVRIEIRGFSPGSVVVDIILVVIPSQSQNISHVSTAVMDSLFNSYEYTVDRNNTSINGTSLFISLFTRVNVHFL